MTHHERPVRRKRVVWRGGRPAPPRPVRSGYADTPGWLLLFESGRGWIDALGLLAGIVIAIRAISRRLSRPSGDAARTR